MGAESQVLRVSYAAFHQLPEAGGLHRLKILGRRPTAPAYGILISAQDGNKGILDPQAEHVQQERSEGDAPIRQQATENQVAHTQLEQLRRDQSFMDREIGGSGDLRG
jgi:hypothetical protein